MIIPIKVMHHHWTSTKGIIESWGVMCYGATPRFLEFFSKKEYENFIKGLRHYKIINQKGGTILNGRNT